MNINDLKAAMLADAIAESVVEASGKMKISTSLLVAAVITRLVRGLYDNLGYEETKEIIGTIMRVVDVTHEKNMDSAKKKTDQIIERITK